MSSYIPLKPHGFYNTQHTDTVFFLLNAFPFKLITLFSSTDPLTLAYVDIYVAVLTLENNITPN